jgi:hypothetical protein
MDDRGVEEGDTYPSATDILRGMGTALGVLALSSLLLFLPPAGTVLMVTFAPLAAGYYGAKSGSCRPVSSWLLLGFSAGMIWSVVVVGALVAVMGGFLGSADPFEPYGLRVLAAVTVSNVLFCILGARMGARAARAVS